MTDIPSLIDLEDHMDFGDEGRRMISEAKRVADGELRCPTCKGDGQVVKGAISHTCLDCKGEGWMTRMEQNLYYGEGGVLDAEEDQAFLDRAAEEAAQEDEDEYGEAQAALEEEL